MTNMIYELLHLANYKDIPNWSVQYADEEDLGFTRRYPMARIGSFLTRRKEAVDIQDGIIYKRVTVSTKGGNITVRDEKDGKVIGTKKQFIIHEGQFLLSKIDARNGAFGVVPAIANGAIITSNFWTYDVDYKRINPLYLTLVTRTQRFLDFAEKSSNGTTNRHYLQEEAFLSQQIPLPNLDEQEKILKKNHDDYEVYQESQRKIDKTKLEIEDYVFSVLSISKNRSDSKNDRFLKFQSLSKLLTWSVNSLHLDGVLFSSLYENQLLGKIIAINPHTSFRHLKDNDKISFIPMQSISEEFACWTGDEQCSKSDSRGYTKFQDGDLLWAKITPCMQNGKSAIVQNLTNGVGCGSTEFYVLNKINEEVDLQYIHCLLRLESLLDDAMKHFTGSAGQQRVPLSYLKNLFVPVPPIEVQNEIVNHIHAIYDEAKKIKEVGLRAKNIAQQKFEQLIFG